MEYMVHVSEPAKIDIRNTINCIGNVLKNPTAADHLLTKVESNMVSLSLMPYRCSLADGHVLALQKIRYLIIGNYYAFYQIDEPTQTVHILRFLYEKSDWRSILKPNDNKYNQSLFSPDDASILSDVK